LLTKLKKNPTTNRQCSARGGWIWS